MQVITDTVLTVVVALNITKCFPLPLESGAKSFKTHSTMWMI